jgi:hypothetical protein
MGAGILMSRTQANAAMAAARAHNSNCSPCPPSPTNGGVTGRAPATGPSPRGSSPSLRQDALHPRIPAGQVAQQTGNNPCGGSGNSSSNVNNQGYTSNPNVIPVSQDQLNARPVSPYQPNPLELPTGQPGGQPATDGNGNPTQPALQSQPGGGPCPPCNGGGDDYETGYECGQQLYYGGDASACPDPRTNSAAYQQGWNDGISNSPHRAQPIGGRYGTRIRRNEYNVRGFGSGVTRQALHRLGI